MDYVIIGAGAAGISAAETLAELEPDAHISIVEAHTQLFVRMYLPDLISGSIKRENIFIKRMPYPVRSRIKLFAGVTTEEIDTVSSSVLLSDGNRLKYDRLLIASGKKPAPVTIEISQDAVYYQTGEPDSLFKASQNIAPLDRATVIGGGFSGIRTAAALAKAGLHVVIAEKRRQLLTDILAPDQSDILVRYLDKAGIKTCLNFDCVSIEKNNILSDTGMEIGSSHVFIACERILSVPLAVGIMLQDGNVMTNHDNIFASGSVIGDMSCAEATESGKEAAWLMTGRAYEKPVLQFPYIFRDLELAICGRFNCEDENMEQVIVKRGYEYKKLVIEDKKLVGYIFIGDARKAKTAAMYMSSDKLIGDPELRELMV